jgi:hypothetical protein
VIAREVSGNDDSVEQQMNAQLIAEKGDPANEPAND